MKSVALDHKENMKIELRNPNPQSQRKEDSGQQIKYIKGNTFLQNVQLSPAYSRLQHRRPDIFHGHDGVV